MRVPSSSRSTVRADLHYGVAAGGSSSCDASWRVAVGWRRQLQEAGRKQEQAASQSKPRARARRRLQAAAAARGGPQTKASRNLDQAAS